MREEAKLAVDRWRKYAKGWRDLNHRTPPTDRQYERQSGNAEAFEQAADELEQLLKLHT